MELIRSVQRACGLLDAFTADGPRLTLAELADRVELPKPTVYRLAVTLIDTGFMTQHADGRYGLGLQVMNIGSIARADLGLVEVCAPVMERLAERTGETVLLGLADWGTLEITIVHRIDSSHELSVVSRVGRRSALALGALGKALLLGVDPAELAAIVLRIDLTPHTERTISDRAELMAEIARGRELGYATDSGEFLVSVSAVAAPITLGGARPIAAVAVVGPSSRLDQRLGLVGGWVRDELAHLAGDN
ncbi:MAG TPA: IclR family transcriptional regulator [Solirubrobacteraceae bacterium]|jgi:DNA-binding IclR family transcriptional regulator|nr:IclR family transcriptional regulator [Solirubrobacteraceae bacterium]